MNTEDYSTYFDNILVKILIGKSQSQKNIDKEISCAVVEDIYCSLLVENEKVLIGKTTESYFLLIQHNSEGYKYSTAMLSKDLYVLLDEFNQEKKDKFLGSDNIEKFIESMMLNYTLNQNLPNKEHVNKKTFKL